MQHNKNRVIRIAEVKNGVISVVDNIAQREIEDITFTDTYEVDYTLIPYLPNIADSDTRPYQYKADFTVHDEVLDRSSTATIWALTEGEKPLGDSYASTTPEIPLLYCMILPEMEAIASSMKQAVLVLV